MTNGCEHWAVGEEFTDAAGRHIRYLKNDEMNWTEWDEGPEAARLYASAEEAERLVRMRGGKATRLDPPDQKA